MFSQRFIISFLMLFFLAGVFVKPAFAMDKTILDEEKTVMPANEHVDNIITLGHDIDIKGKVDVSAIVINGNLKISKSARINGLVLVINGNVDQEPGSSVKENILAFKFNSDTINHLLIGFGLLLSSWLLRFIFSVGFVLISVLASLIIKNKGEQELQLMKQQPGKLLLIGIAASFVLIGLIVLLIISVIGIPIAVILAIPALVAFIIGLTIIGQYLGEKLITKIHPSRWITTFAGSFVLISILNFPFFGFIIVLCIFWISLGLMVMWMKDKMKRKGHL